MPTYDKLVNVCPALLLLLYDKVWKESKSGGTHGPPFFPSAVVALMSEARKFEMIFEKGQ